MRHVKALTAPRCPSAAQFEELNKFFELGKKLFEDLVSIGVPLATLKLIFTKAI